MTVMPPGQKLPNTASKDSLGSYPSLGMSMRFSVRLGRSGTYTDLGLWQSCKNLQMELQYKKFALGGSLVDQWLPERIAYSPVTLERPMEKEPSTKIKRWLETYIRAWNEYPSQGSRPPSTEVTIKLLDYHLNPVMEWILDDARPSKWIGPSLSATDNKVAIESLVIEHSGILPEKDTSSGTLPGGGVKEPKETARAKLSPADKKVSETGKIEEVVFYFNPKELTISHGSKIKDYSSTSKQEDPKGGKKGADHKQKNVPKEEPPSLSLPKMMIDGFKTLEYCERLLDWSYASIPDNAPQSNQAVLPDLEFTWGDLKIRDKKTIKVNITKVDINYERFNANAEPTRASVTLNLLLVDKATPVQQNPTSGGLPGRGGHLLVTGDTLAGIALDTYGNPASWRSLAVANEIDDPLRLRPGLSVYLPGHAELVEGGTP
jgi:phage tail-like protein